MSLVPWHIIEADSLQTSASGMAAQRIRMNVLANNLANIQTTRDAAGNFAPFLRKEVLFKTAKIDPNKPDDQGVLLDRIVPSRVPFQLRHDPEHPEADERGYRRVPNVSVPREMVNMIEASRAYEANLAAMTIAGSAKKKDVDILLS